jgi:hypothetical protein
LSPATGDITAMARLDMTARPSIWRASWMRGRVSSPAARKIITSRTGTLRMIST